MKRMTWFGIGAAVLVAGGGIAWVATRDKDEVKFRYAKVERGAIRQRVSATGQLSAVVQVSVGTQVSGMITMINADFNSIVKAGQVIAQIDATPWEQGVKDAEASLTRVQSNYDDAKRQLDRTRRLFKEKLVAEQDLDTKQAAFDSARASLESSRINLEKAKVNLGYCTIKAPVDGVVVSRLADVGQTVAASFSTPNLFTIAQDLSKMKLEVNVDEADIAQLKVGQTASFTVDSIQDTQFRGRVTQVRLEPVVQQNVVNYKVVVEVDNQTQEEIQANKERRQAMMDAMQGGNGKPGEAKAPEAKQPEAPKAEAKKPEAPKPQAAGEVGSHGEGRGMGMMGGGNGFDPDAMWERAKDRIQERQPGITKEQWIKQMKERMAQFQQGGGRRPEGRHVAGAEKKASSGASRQPGGIIKAGGPFYGGEYVLRPGMTANVTIVTQEKADVIRVPNAALRFNPMNFIKDEKAEAARPAQAAPGTPGGQSGNPMQDRRARMADRGFMARREDKVWILENGKPKSLPVKAGLTDGQFTEITADLIKEGMQIMVGVEEAKKTATAAPAMGGMGGMGGGRR